MVNVGHINGLEVWRSSKHQIKFRIKFHVNIFGHMIVVFFSVRHLLQHTLNNEPEVAVMESDLL